MTLNNLELVVCHRWKSRAADHNTLVQLETIFHRSVCTGCSRGENEPVVSRPAAESAGGLPCSSSSANAEASRGNIVPSGLP
eukprot:CAMPEP_0174977118 /NCGR_PEP_ID=MMETSP0004_2-20121128/13427_1 /TAXON_ID=420556 /ORGANISM="Ochromonas sp., Strain CCMP1393" /LENGTH=81 /DNA_ID=CAMNT_0016228257 /DNA_START=413 /DNA_END=661 /DNA_ORIENTATION=-